MESNIEYGSLEFCMEIIDFVWDYVYLDHGSMCIWTMVGIYMVFKPRVC